MIKNYCKSKDSKDDIFKMQQQEDESLEEYLKIFLYNYKKSKQRLNDNTVRTIFLKGIRDEYIDVLNLMGTRDVSRLTFEEISNLCKKYSRSKVENGKGIRDTRIKKSASRGVTREELGNLLENFKTDILSTLSSLFDTIRTKKKQNVENAILTIFCSRCMKRHPLKECPLNIVSICVFCTKNHQT